MNPLIALALAALMTTSAIATDATFYLGTYTQSGKSKGIYIGTIDTDTGKLGPVTLAGEAKSPSFVALAPNQKFLYAALEDDGAVGAYSIGADGKLKVLNTRPAGGEGTCHVWVDATGKNVLVANYNSGSIAVFQTKDDGSLGERTSFVQFEGHGPDKDRQEGPHAHSIYTDATNRFVYACDLGTDNVWVFKFDAEKGALTPANPPSGKVPSGAGPRHFAQLPGGKFAYADNEMALSVTAFSRDAESGALTALDTLSTMPAGADKTGASVAEIFLHPTAKWLYVSNRGHDSITVYAVGADGKLTWIENVPALVKVPRGFGIDPTGKWMITAGQDDDRIAVLKIDPATGKLTGTDQSAEVGSPVCVLFTPPK